MQKLIDIATPVFIGVLAGFVKYMHKMYKGERFRFVYMLISMVLAGFVGYITGELLPKDLEIRNAIIGISGFAAAPILDYFEFIGPKIFSSLFPKKD